MAHKSGGYGHYSGNHPKFSSSEAHKHYMENSVHDFETGHDVAGKYEAKKAGALKNIGVALGAPAAAGYPGSSINPSAPLKEVSKRGQRIINQGEKALDAYRSGNEKKGNRHTARATRMNTRDLKGYKTFTYTEGDGTRAEGTVQKTGEPMHASVSSAVKNVLGPDNPHSHGKSGKVVMDNAMKMKNDNDGGGPLAGDPGAAGRELLYNQSQASGVQRRGKHKGY